MTITATSHDDESSAEESDDEVAVGLILGATKIVGMKF